MWVTISVGISSSAPWVEAPGMKAKVASRGSSVTWWWLTDTVASEPGASPARASWIIEIESPRKFTT